MDQHQTEWNEKVARMIIKSLEKRRMAGSYTATADQARDEIIEMIPSGATVFRCGSMSAVGMGLWDSIAALPEVNLIDPYRPELSPEEAMELRRRGEDGPIYDFKQPFIAGSGEVLFFNINDVPGNIAGLNLGPDLGQTAVVNLGVYCDTGFFHKWFLVGRNRLSCKGHGAWDEGKNK